MNPKVVLETLVGWGPVLFGVGFLAPLTAQSLEALSLGAPFGMSPLVFGLILGGGAGLSAKLRGGLWV